MSILLGLLLLNVLVKEERNPSFLWYEDTINSLYGDLVTVLSLHAAGL